MHSNKKIEGPRRARNLIKEEKLEYLKSLGYEL